MIMIKCKHNWKMSNLVTNDYNPKFGYYIAFCENCGKAEERKMELKKLK